MFLRAALAFLVVHCTAEAVWSQTPDSPTPPRFAQQSRFFDSKTEHARALFMNCFRSRMELNTKLSRPTAVPEIRKDTPFTDVLEYICDRNDLTMIIDTKAFERAGVKEVDKIILGKERLAGLKDPSARQMMDAVLALVPDGTWMIRRDYIEITTRKEMKEIVQRRLSRLRKQLVEVVPQCRSLDDLGALAWTILGDLLGHRLDDCLALPEHDDEPSCR